MKYKPLEESYPTLDCEECEGDEDCPQCKGEGTYIDDSEMEIDEAITRAGYSFLRINDGFIIIRDGQELGGFTISEAWDLLENCSPAPKQAILPTWAPRKR